MQSTIQILPFSPEHGSGVVDVILTIQQSEFDIPITLAAQPDLQNIPSFYQRDAGNFWVALHASRVIGTIALLDIGNAQVALRKMFVTAAYRGSDFGVAKKLLDVSLDWCRDRQVASVYLGTTPKFLAAHRFYEKNGFNEIAQSSLPANFPIMQVDKKFYCKLISR